MRWNTMTERIVLSQIEQVPSDARVHHYDELPERAKNHLPSLIETDASEVAVSERAVAAFEPYEFVKFTDYYRITVREEPPSVPQVR